jgi:flagellar L-ring protein FlgH
MNCRRRWAQAPREQSCQYTRTTEEKLRSPGLLLCLAQLLLAFQALAGAPPATKGKAQVPMNDPSAGQIDRLLAMPPSTGNAGSMSTGSTYSVDGSLADLSADFRARHLGDQLTVVVLDSASAVASGVTSEKRQSSANASVTSLFGVKSPTGALANLAASSGQQQLAGQGSTTRATTLSTKISVRVLRVLPNGDLIVEGSKLIAINSEFQTITLRGIVRQVDLGPLNSVISNQVADLEVRINGQGVVNDAIRRPNFLYRLFLGLLPF